MLRIMDCALRDGANVVGKGFSRDITQLILEGLTQNGVQIIEFGNALGLGAYEKRGAIAPLTDLEYLKVAEPFSDKAELGMFMLAANADKEKIRQVKESGMKFIRIGANAGDGHAADHAISLVKEAGLTARYSLMKAYVLSAEELAQEAQQLEKYGADEVTVMDSAGTMLPTQVGTYVKALTECLQIPVAFHGHSNLGLCMANALAAYDAGAQVIDCSILGMARSAGNIPTEVATAVFQRLGVDTGINLYGLLEFIDTRLLPEMKKIGYDRALTPEELVYGLSGCHSSFAGMFAKIAKELNVDRYRLIIEASKLDQKAPSEALIRSVAEGLK